MKTRLGLVAAVAVFLCACTPQPITKPPPSAAVQDLTRQQALRAIATTIGTIRGAYVDETDVDRLVDLAVAGILRRGGFPYKPNHARPPAKTPAVAWESSNPQDARRWRHLVAVYLYVKDHRPKLSNEALAKAAVDSVLGSLDSQSAFYTRKQFHTIVHGARAGVGLVLRKADDRIFVLKPLANSPASRAGLRRGDTIVSIDGRSVAGEALPDVTGRLRGAADTSVHLGVRTVDGRQRTVELKRARVRDPAFVFRWYNRDIGYLRINRLARHTAGAIREAAVGWRANPSRMRGLILDLRDDPGGILGEAAQVADLFLRNGLIAKISARDPRFRVDFHAGDDHSPLESVPMVVLVNHGTASGAELIAAALQNHHRARVVGYHTLGLGTVQTLVPLPGGMALKLTTGKLLTSGLVALQGNGVTPDVCVGSDKTGGCRQNDAANDALEPYMAKALRLLGVRKSAALQQRSTGTHHVTG
jgi:carboxyl-terminal processing protease